MTIHKENMKVKICSSCKAKFQCEENPSCWCHELPTVSIIDDNNENDCICPKCLQVRIGNN